MARLVLLPLELLLTAQILHNQRDINALVQTNKTPYSALYAFLCRFNVEHYQGSAPFWAAQNGYTCLATRLHDAGADSATYERSTEAKYNPDNWIDILFKD
ncbi:hypothetical protein BDV39DRAFT_210021 [Aspergillus sergii]|uniref:Ankyrin repeat-containing domain protein n=1 Tax=Aspergillus sergii TaxID=1034303 RepID=A0A5N6WMS9_9EURO|nr:hypothetical protein BDV39DRAFT_210021 [Aspergillus sergii]